MTRGRTLGRLALALAGGAVAAVAGWVLFVEFPRTLAELLGVLVVVSLVPLGLRIGRSLGASLLAEYNVAEVAVEGQISRDGGGGGLPSSPTGASADDVVDQVERADDDGNVDALLVKLNTPGGEIVPSDDIKLAVERFDGPVVAYTTDLCASGGYAIACGCDELWARRGSLVGSIGVIGSRVTAAELREKLGLSYEQLTAGEYKDAGVPLRDLEPDEREYLQGLVDGFYEDFVADVVEGRDMDAEAVRETEARVYLGPEAADLGLVDAIGTREDVEDRLEERLGEAVAVESFTPDRGLAARLRGGASQVAYALGAGIGGAVGDRDGVGVEFRR